MNARIDSQKHKLMQENRRLKDALVQLVNVFGAGAGHYTVPWPEGNVAKKLVEELDLKK